MDTRWIPDPIKTTHSLTLYALKRTKTRQDFNTIALTSAKTRVFANVSLIGLSKERFQFQLNKLSIKNKMLISMQNCENFALRVKIFILL